MIGRGNFEWLAKVFCARERLDDRPFPKNPKLDFSKLDEPVFDQLLALDLKRPTFFQIDELFV